jgi:HAD superfamily hydrolase (TIGR01509 family)
MVRAIIFDFDGVIADSEVISNAVLAQLVSELGVPTTIDDSYRDYMGKRAHEVIAAIELHLGRSVPTGFAEDFQKRTLSRLRADLQPVDGVRKFIATFRHLPRCIASSSPPDRLAACLQILGMESLFHGRVFSASIVARGKPHPDIFLHAAAEIGVSPERCLVIEDSAGGVIAGRAAGATVIGLLAAGHIRDGHATVLSDAGAHHVVRTYQEAEEVIRNLVRTLE